MAHPAGGHRDRSDWGWAGETQAEAGRNRESAAAQDRYEEAENVSRWQRFWWAIQREQEFGRWPGWLGRALRFARHRGEVTRQQARAYDRQVHEVMERHLRTMLDGRRIRW